MGNIKEPDFDVWAAKLREEGVLLDMAAGWIGVQRSISEALEQSYKQGYSLGKLENS